MYMASVMLCRSVKIQSKITDTSEGTPPSEDVVVPILSSLYRTLNAKPYLLSLGV